MFKTRRGLLFIILLALFGWGGLPLTGLWDYFNHETPAQKREVIITTQAQKHILYGDDRGGGHKYGIGKPCKSEFPQDWDNEKILKTIRVMAANDNLTWKEQKNGYYVSEQIRDDVQVRVVLNRDKDSVVTAYPVKVKRNPCPAAANDNTPQ